MATSNYQQWIAAHMPTDPRGQCVEMTKSMVDAFPELRRVRGHFTCAEGRRPHWWLVTPSGEVVDPTVEQFGSRGFYEEYAGPEPKGHCLNCGELVFDDVNFCDTQCARELADFLNEGGTLSINAKQVYP